MCMLVVVVLVEVLRVELVDDRHKVVMGSVLACTQDRCASACSWLFGLSNCILAACCTTRSRSVIGVHRSC